MEPTEVTLTGYRMWIVAGVVFAVFILIATGLVLPEARTYIVDTSKVLLGVIPVIK